MHEVDWYFPISFPNFLSAKMKSKHTDDEMLVINNAINKNDSSTGIWFQKRKSIVRTHMWRSVFIAWDEIDINRWHGINEFNKQRGSGNEPRFFFWRNSINLFYYLQLCVSFLLTASRLLQYKIIGNLWGVALVQLNCL